MSEFDVGRVLLELRSISRDNPLAESKTSQESTAFAELIKNGIEAVNETQQKAAELATAFEQGAEDVDLAQVMIELQKASLSFRAMTEVRNRLVSAYQDIMNMPI